MLLLRLALDQFDPGNDSGFLSFLIKPMLKLSCTLKKQCKGHFSGLQRTSFVSADSQELLGSIASFISGAGRRGSSNVFDYFGDAGCCWLALSLPIAAQWGQKLRSKQLAHPHCDSSSMSAVCEDGAQLF